MADAVERHIATFLTWHDMRALQQTSRNTGFPAPAPVHMARIACRRAWRAWSALPRRRYTMHRRRPRTTQHANHAAILLF